MKQSSRVFCLILLIWPCIAFCVWSAEENIPRLETYFVADQVDSLLGTEEARAKALQRLREVGITKVYLECLRSGYIPKRENLIAARDFFEENGIEVSTGVTTTRGENFGEPSNQPGYWLHYESAKTQEDLKRVIQEHAPLFRELMVDDFWATNDTSERSMKAKGEREWSKYRLDLMSRLGRECIIEPAKEANPQIQIIQKFPQWYDRYHKFGYDVIRAPQMYDRIWVGTETRNPDTKRFGFTMATEGYINFSWLRSIAKDKIGGGWYDFGDCTAETYLMQAYQTTLAGAKELNLFEAGSVLADNPCMETFMQRREALWALGQIVKDKKPLGMIAYKPPQSEGSDANGAANLYIYDYLAAMGLSPVMTAEFNLNDYSSTKAPFTMTGSEKYRMPAFFSRQAAADPNIHVHIIRLLQQGNTVVLTPDLLMAINNKEITELTGYAHPFSLSQEFIHADSLRANDQNLSASPTIEIRVIPAPEQGEVICAAISDGKEIPILSKSTTSRSKGRLLVLNLSTFTHEEFSPGNEEFLPPRPLSTTRWPQEMVDRIRHEIYTSTTPDRDLTIQAPNQVGVYQYPGLLVLANFNNHPVKCSVDHFASVFDLNRDFPHADGARRAGRWSGSEAHIPAWEIVVIDVKQ